MFLIADIPSLLSRSNWELRFTSAVEIRQTKPTKGLWYPTAGKLSWRDTTHERVYAGRPAMPLEITQREMNGIYLLTLKGRLALGQESNGLRTVIDDLLGSGVNRIILNLEHVHYVDSAGLGALIELHRKAKTKGGRLLLCHLGPKLKQALELARLLPLFETSPTEEAAIASF
jgi:anti-anti-sigma factor